MDLGKAISTAVETANSAGDQSRDETVVEYAVQEIIKRKSTPRTAAKSVAAQFNGTTNIFINSARPISIDEHKLEEAIWDRFVELARVSIPKMKAGMEHFAIDGTVQHYYSWEKPKPAIRAELKKRIIKALGKNPFTGEP